MFSKISLNLVIVGFCCHGNIQSNCCTGCLKYAFESFVCLLLVDMNGYEVIFILCSQNNFELKTLVLKIGFKKPDFHHKNIAKFIFYPRAGLTNRQIH